MSRKKRRGEGSGDQPKRAAKKRSLPAFGFAEDLLKSGKNPLSEEGARASSDTPAPSPEDSSLEKADPEEASTPKKKISLPAFGFAEDLLRQLKSSGEVSEEATDPHEPQDGPSATTRATATSVPPQSSPETQETDEETPAPPSSGRSEERIFDFADSLAASEDEEKKKAPVRLETWITFDLAEETFALPVEPVHEIVRPSGITRVPHAPHPIRGVTNLRGRVVPVIDLRLRLELPENEVSKGSRIIVVGSRGRRLGLLVDAVHQVAHLDVDRVQPPPEDVMTVQSDYISGVYHLGEELILLLDVDRVLIIKEAAGTGTSDPLGRRGAA